MIALGTAVAVLDARLVAISGTHPVVVPLTATERFPHMERVELDAVPVATRSPVANVADGFQLSFASSGVLDGSVGLIEVGNGYVVNPEFEVLRPRAVVASTDLANASPTGSTGPASDLFFLDQYDLGASLYENSDVFEMPVVLRECPPSIDLAANATDEWLR